MVEKQQLLKILKKSGSTSEVATEDFDKEFREVGLDSLDVFNFLSEIEIELGKPVSDEEFESLGTLDDVLNFVNS